MKNLGLKFYAGAVLRSPEGTPVGTLCVMDKKRRNLTEPQKRQLQILARSTEAAMEEHRQKSSRLSQDWGEIQGCASKGALNRPQRAALGCAGPCLWLRSARGRAIASLCPWRRPCPPFGDPPASLRHPPLPPPLT